MLRFWRDSPPTLASSEEQLNEYIANWCRNRFTEYGQYILIVELRVTSPYGEVNGFETVRDYVTVNIDDDTHYRVTWGHDLWEYYDEKMFPLNISRLEDMRFP